MLPLKDNQPSLRFPFWSVSIIVLNIYVFYIELTSPNIDELISDFALIPAALHFNNLGSLTPLVTSLFLHGGFLHIISNMWFLWIFGNNVEEKLGFTFFPIFYLLSGFTAAVMEYIFIPNTIAPMLGASGAIAGVLGAYFALFPNHKISTLILIFGIPAIIQVSASIILAYWFFLQLFSGTASIFLQSIGGIAWFAHIGGFVFGWTVGKLFKD